MSCIEHMSMPGAGTIKEYLSLQREVEQLDYNIERFKPGDLVALTLKMHGTSGRTAYLPSAGRNKFESFIFKLFPRYRYVTGTRRVVLNEFDGGFYGDNAFRKSTHDFLQGKLKKGETIYYEIVGYVNDNTPIMGKANNKKMNDPEFVKNMEIQQFSHMDVYQASTTHMCIV